MRRRAIRAAAAGLLAAAAVAGTVPAAQAEPVMPTRKCQLPFYPWAGLAEQTAGWRLTAGQSLVAKDNESILVMQADGNLVLSLVNSTGGPNHEIWSSGTWGHPGAYAVLQDDGNFVVYRAGGGPETGGALWSTGTWGLPGATVALWPGGNLMVGTPDRTWRTYTAEEPSALCPGVDGATDELRQGSWAQSASVWLVVQPDGNVVLYRKRDDKAIWSTGTWGHSNSVLRMQADGNLAVYPVESYGRWDRSLWASGTWGHPGAYAVLQDDGNLVIYQRDGQAIWATGTWGQ
ncbi:hypothetical protein [Kitasatospora phosalacinea]|uniref:hypothetical protein n=1 Tax=Kitasatospora phosalacinea TaxID=2065 RepID=UPI000689E852|nr:hypothetical protein [Kitasatospora phosalacinea]